MNTLRIKFLIIPQANKNTKETKPLVNIKDKGLFVNFVSPFLISLDNGLILKRAMEIFYLINAFAFLLVPFYVIYKLIDSNFFKYSYGSVVFTAVVLLISLAIICWVCFQIWLNRKNKIYNSTTKDAKFIAIPLIADFLEVLGETFGIFYSLVSFFIALFSLIYKDNGTDVLYPLFPAIANTLSSVGLIQGIFVGFLIILITRFTAEQIKVFAVIANNIDKNN